MYVFGYSLVFAVLLSFPITVMILACWNIYLSILIDLLFIYFFVIFVVIANAVDCLKRSVSKLTRYSKMGSRMLTPN